MNRIVIKADQGRQRISRLEVLRFRMGIHVANIAQTIDVLQAMILTEGAKTVPMPTCHPTG